MKGPSYRAIVALAATFAAVVITTAVAFAAATDDEIPGRVLPASPFQDSLTETTAVGPGNTPLWDIDDVYQVRLGFNQRLDFQMRPPTRADFDLYLIAPGTRRLSDAFTPPFGPVVRASEGATGAVESLTFVSSRSTPATYYVDVAQQFDGSGEYTVTWKRTQLPTPLIASSVPSESAFGGSVLITGTAMAAGRAMAAFPLEVRTRPLGGSTWTRVAVATTTADGSFSARIRPTRPSEYRVVTSWSETVQDGAYGYGFGPVMRVTPRAYLTIRAPRYATRGRLFTVEGALKPGHAAGSGHVRVTAERLVGGKWVASARSFSARHTTTSWSARIALSVKGTWRIRAVATADGMHARTQSSLRTVRVR